MSAVPSTGLNGAHLGLLPKSPGREEGWGAQMTPRPGAAVADTICTRIHVLLSHNITFVLVLVELTVSWEDRMEEAHERKKAKYLQLVEACREIGWGAHCEPAEVDCRGFPQQSSSLAPWLQRFARQKRHHKHQWGHGRSLKVAVDQDGRRME